MRPALQEDAFPPLPSQVAKRPPKRMEKRLPAKMNLLNLPNELLMEIIDFVLPTCFLEQHEFQSAGSLSLVNKRFSEIIRQRYNSNMYSSYDTRIGSPFLFLRTMMTNPHIAAKIQQIGCFKRSSSYAVDAPYRLSLEDKRIIKSGFKKLEIPHWKEWASVCISEEVDDQDLCAAIMMLAHNLATLRVDESSERFGVPPWLKLIKQIVSGTQFGRASALSHLEEVEVALNHNHLRLHELIHLFRVSTLKSLTFRELLVAEPHRLEHSDNPRIPWWILKAPNPPSPIQEFCLFDCYIEVDTLVRLIKSCAALKSFRLRQFPYPEEFDDLPSDIFRHYDQLDQALTQHYATLEQVYVEEAANNFAIEPERRSQTLFRSFSQMPKLSVLSLPLSALVNRCGPDRSAEHSASTLPPSLQEFIVNNIRSGWSLCLQSLLRHTLACVRNGRLPHLNIIRLQATRFATSDSLDTVEEQYKKECSELNIRLYVEREKEDEWDETSDDDMVVASEM